MLNVWRVTYYEIKTWLPGVDPGGGAPPPPPKIGKNMIFWRKIVIFHTKYPQKCSRLPPFGAIFLSAPPLTWNPGSAPGYCLSYGNRILIALQITSTCSCFCCCFFLGGGGGEGGRVAGGMGVDYLDIKVVVVFLLTTVDPPHIRAFSSQCVDLYLVLLLSFLLYNIDIWQRSGLYCCRIGYYYQQLLFYCHFILFMKNNDNFTFPE